MTRATDKPLRRIVDAGAYGEFVLEVTARTARLRPIRVRRPEAAIELPWAMLYTHALMVRDADRRRAKAKRR